MKHSTAPVYRVVFLEAVLLYMWYIFAMFLLYRVTADSVIYYSLNQFFSCDPCPTLNNLQIQGTFYSLNLSLRGKRSQSCSEVSVTIFQTVRFKSSTLFVLQREEKVNEWRIQKTLVREHCFRSQRWSQYAQTIKVPSSNLVMHWNASLSSIQRFGL